MNDYEKNENLELDDDLFNDEDINYQSYSSDEGGKRKTPVSTIILALLFIVVIILVIIVVKNAFGGNDNIDEAIVDNSTTTQADKTQSTLPKNFENIELTEEDKNKGELILVNGTHSTTDLSESKMVDLFETKTASYTLRNSKMFVSKDIYSNINAWFDDFYKESGKRTINIIDAFRSHATQKQLFDAALGRYETEKEAVKNVQKQGYSEHHTGLCIDIQVYENGYAYTFNGEGEYEWVVNNAYKYGFIQRYPEGKTTITGVNTELGHFRYIGVAHATAMKQSNASCFESYIDLLRSYTFDGEHLNVNCDNGDKYEIYFTNSLSVPVPTDREYTVSGNNVDGFIVTIKN